jgi:hypothetical protein
MKQTIAARWIVKLERLKHGAYADACDKMQTAIVSSRWDSDSESPVNTFKDGSRMRCLLRVGRIELSPVKSPKLKAKAAKAGE